MLSIQNITYRVGGRTLLDNVSVNIRPGGAWAGGPQWCRKSTLFRLSPATSRADGGDISFIKGASLGMVRQDLPDDETTILDVVLNGDTERTALLAEAETVEDPETYELYL